MGASAQRAAGTVREGGAARGIVLPLVLLLLLALTALAHGVLLLATVHDVASRGLGEWVEARVAEAAVRRRLLAALAADTLPELAVGEARRMAGGNGSGEPGPFHLVRVESELHLLGTPRGARALSALEPAARLAEVRAVVERGGALMGRGGVDASAGRLSGPGEELCMTLLARTDSLLGRPWQPASAAPLPGWDTVPGPPALGALAGDSILARLGPIPPGVVTPGPGEACRPDDPTNWGTPSDPLGPCGTWRPGLAVAGDLTVEGGEGQGVLVVSGRLELRDGARFHGLVLVGGDLVLADAARLEGLARVRGDVELRGGARIVGRGCPVLLSLVAAHRLRRPVVLAEPLPLDF